MRIQRLAYAIDDGGPDQERPGCHLVRLTLNGSEVLRIPAEEAERLGHRLVKAGQQGQGRRR